MPEWWSLLRPRGMPLNGDDALWSGPRIVVKHALRATLDPAERAF